MTNITAAAVVPTWTLTDRLRKARDHAHLTQAQLAKRLDVSEKTVKRYEAGEQAQLRTLVAWAWCTGIDVQWLLRGVASDNNGDGGPTAITEAVTGWETVPSLTDRRAFREDPAPRLAA